MERLERFYKIDQLLKDRRPVSFSGPAIVAGDFGVRR